MKFAFIKEHLTEFPVEVCCDVLEAHEIGQLPVIAIAHDQRRALHALEHHRHRQVFVEAESWSAFGMRS